MVVIQGEVVDSAAWESSPVNAIKVRAPHSFDCLFNLIEPQSSLCARQRMVLGASAGPREANHPLE